ncbi:MAG: tetratricopeptide repeat protein, partial [Elusimicrobia bacterium]|nr:tetratricopeptide repeat protein [Candidatus Liberimonas magnetica]
MKYFKRYKLKLIYLLRNIVMYFLCNQRFKKIVSSITLACFLISFVFGEVLHASIEKRSKTDQLHRSLEDLIIPQSFGRITDSCIEENEENEANGIDKQGDEHDNTLSVKRNPLVINIQDLHCHPEVQRNISKILASLDKNYGFNSIYVEGGYGKVSTSWLCNIKDEELKNHVLENLIAKGRLTGTEHYSVVSNKPGLLKGIENEAVHKLNIIRLGKILNKKAYFSNKIKDFDRDIEFMKARYFTAKNKSLNRLVEKHKKAGIQTNEYYVMLAKYVEKINKNPGKYNNILALNMANYPNVNKYLELNRLAKQLKYKRVAVQMQEFMGLIKNKLSYSAYTSLIQKTDNFSKADELYIYLANISRSSGFRGQESLEKFSELYKFFEYTEKSQSLNPIKLINEEKRLVEEIRIAFSQDTSELEVSFLCDFYIYFRDYLSNTLAAEDYEYFKQRFDRFKKIWGKYALNNRIAGMSKDFDLLSGFYETNCKRNDCFVKNIDELENIQGAGDSRQGTAETSKSGIRNPKSISSLLKASEIVVVVTGGFHSEGLKKILKKKKISYISVTPNVTQDTTVSNQIYCDLVKKQATALLKQKLQNQYKGTQLFQTQSLALVLGSNDAKVISETKDSITIEIEGEPITLSRNDEESGFKLQGKLDKVLTVAGKTYDEQHVQQALELAVDQALLIAKNIEGLERPLLSAEIIRKLVVALSISAAKAGLLEGLFGGGGLIWAIASSKEIQDLITSEAKIDLTELDMLPEYIQEIVMNHALTCQKLKTIAKDKPLLSAIISINGMQEFFGSLLMKDFELKTVSRQSQELPKNITALTEEEYSEFVKKHRLEDEYWVGPNEYRISDKELSTMGAGNCFVPVLIDQKRSRCLIGHFPYTYLYGDKERRRELNPEFYAMIDSVREEVSAGNFRLYLFAGAMQSDLFKEDSEAEKNRVKKSKEEIFDAFASIGIKEHEDLTPDEMDMILKGIIADPKSNTIRYFYKARASQQAMNKEKESELTKKAEANAAGAAAKPGTGLRNEKDIDGTIKEAKVFLKKICKSAREIVAAARLKGGVTNEGDLDIIEEAALEAEGLIPSFDELIKFMKEGSKIEAYTLSEERIQELFNNIVPGNGYEGKLTVQVQRGANLSQTNIFLIERTILKELFTNALKYGKEEIKVAIGRSEAGNIVIQVSNIMMTADELRAKTISSSGIGTELLKNLKEVFGEGYSSSAKQLSLQGQEEYVAAVTIPDRKPQGDIYEFVERTLFHELGNHMNQMIGFLGTNKIEGTLDLKDTVWEKPYNCRKQLGEFREKIKDLVSRQQAMPAAGRLEYVNIRVEGKNLKLKQVLVQVAKIAADIGMVEKLDSGEYKLAAGHDEVDIDGLAKALYGWHTNEKPVVQVKGSSGNEVKVITPSLALFAAELKIIGPDYNLLSGHTLGHLTALEQALDTLPEKEVREREFKQEFSALQEKVKESPEKLSDIIRRLEDGEQRLKGGTDVKQAEEDIKKALADLRDLYNDINDTLVLVCLVALSLDSTLANHISDKVAKPLAMLHGSQELLEEDDKYEFINEPIKLLKDFQLAGRFNNLFGRLKVIDQACVPDKEKGNGISFDKEIYYKEMCRTLQQELKNAPGIIERLQKQPDWQTAGPDALNELHELAATLDIYFREVREFENLLANTPIHTNPAVKALWDSVYPILPPLWNAIKTKNYQNIQPNIQLLLTALADKQAQIEALSKPEAGVNIEQPAATGFTQAMADELIKELLATTPLGKCKDLSDEIIKVVAGEMIKGERLQPLPKQAIDTDLQTQANEVLGELNVDELKGLEIEVERHPVNSMGLIRIEDGVYGHCGLVKEGNKLKFLVSDKFYEIHDKAEFGKVITAELNEYITLNLRDRMEYLILTEYIAKAATRETPPIRGDPLDPVVRFNAYHQMIEEYESYSNDKEVHAKSKEYLLRNQDLSIISKEITSIVSKLYPGIEPINKLIEMLTEVPMFIKPEAGTPVSVPNEAKEIFDEGVFTNEIVQAMVESMAELMDYVSFEFVDKDNLPKGAKGYNIKKENKEIKTTIFRQENEGAAKGLTIITDTTVHIAKDISFLEFIGLIKELEEKTRKEGKLVLRRKVPVESILEYIRSSIRYFEEINSGKPNAKLNDIINGLKELLGNEQIVVGNLSEDEKHRAELWLGLTRKDIEDALKSENELNTMVSGLNRNLCYELMEPYRVFDSNLIERGGQVLDGLNAINEKGKVIKDRQGQPVKLKDYIAGEVKIKRSKGLSRQEEDKEIIKLVQDTVTRYNDRILHFKPDMYDKLALSFGIPKKFISYREIKPTDIVQTNHMRCVMMSYLCARILKEYGFEVYWAKVNESYEQIQEGHVAVVVRSRDGLFSIVDAAQPGGSGAIGEYLTLGEIEEHLKKEKVYTKELKKGSEAYPKNRHHKISILRLEDGVKASVYYNLGNIYNEKKNPDYDRAIECFLKALEINPKDPGALNNLEIAYVSKPNREYDKAIKCLLRALEINPKDPVALHNLGNVYRDKPEHEYGKAIECYIKALEIDPKFNYTWYNIELLFNSKGFEELGKEVRDYKNKAKAGNPKLTVATVNAFFGREDVQEAIKSISNKVVTVSDISKNLVKLEKPVTRSSWILPVTVLIIFMPFIMLFVKLFLVPFGIDIPIYKNLFQYFEPGYDFHLIITAQRLIFPNLQNLGDFISKLSMSVKERWNSLVNIWDNKQLMALSNNSTLPRQAQLIFQFLDPNGTYGYVSIPLMLLPTILLSFLSSAFSMPLLNVANLVLGIISIYLLIKVQKKFGGV